jgi:hypothetical protein
MIDLDAFQQDEVSQFGAQVLREYREKAKSFEDAAQRVALDIFNTFKDRDRNPAFALVRVYHMTPYELLSDELRPLAAPHTPLWMSMMATRGVEAAWNDRRKSQGHRVIPAGDQRTPMVAAAFQQIGLDEAPPSVGVIFNEVTFMTRYFHVANALGSPYIPAQAEFVVPYQIRSVIGLGARFASGNAHLTLCFSKVPINEEDAHKLAVLSAHISTLFAYFDTRRLWN